MNIRAILSTSGINFAFRMMGLMLSFLNTVLITNFFGISVFGNYSLVFTVSQATAIIFTLGIPNAMIKLVGNHNFSELQARRLLMLALKGALFFSIVPIVVFLAGSGFISDTVFSNPDLKPYMLIVTICMPLFIIHEILLYFFVATKKFNRYNLFMFVVPNVLLALNIWTAYHFGLNGSYTFWAFALAVLLTVIAELFVIFEIHPEKHTVPYRTRDLLRIASPMMFSSLLLYLLTWTNSILLGIFSDEKQVGIYNVVSRVGSVGFLIIVSVSTIITPRIAQIYGEGNLDALKKLVHGATRLIVVLSLPAGIMIIVLGKFLLSFFGDEAIAGYSSLCIIVAGVMFSSFCGNTDQILNMTDGQRVLRNITIGSFFVNLVLGYFLIPGRGVEGAAISSLFTNGFLNLLCLYYVRKRLGFYTLF